MLAWSPEARVLFRPGATFHALADEQTSGAWTLLRRPLFLAFVFGCLVSIQASGRVSARLVTDGIVSFAFVPVFEILSVWIVYSRRQRPVGFAQAVDLFFVANAPWLVWMLAFAALRSFQTPVQATALPDWWQWVLLLSLVPMIAWSVFIDLPFFRNTLHARHPGRTLVVQRAISWTCILGWYVGHELWQLIAVWIRV